MDSNQIDDHAERTSEETHSSETVLSDASDASNDSVFGIPQIHPRVGKEYQAEIPPMPEQSKHLLLHPPTMDPVKSQVLCDSSVLFAIGLPVPIIWVPCRTDISKDEPITLLDGSVDKIGLRMSLNRPSLNKGEPVSKAGHFPVPGLPLHAWSDFEVDCFILGLYIFGKNLVQVKRFIENKDIGQIISFYYGKFYKSPGYCRWSDCRKMKSKKCVTETKIFTGCRQQELLSRLLPLLSSEESMIALQEVSSGYTGGKTSLEEYVSTLKNMVGIRALVEAIGIGKGKDKDLTMLILENSKNSQMLKIRSEVPSGKACSSLSSTQIIKFLTGDFRLSKARANDLFWEAVWPRLLANGWHSEQPKNELFKGSKNGLVFLVPGVKKFSSRRLLKGEHYFDCVSDVLRKVASHPKVLEMGAEEEAVGAGKRPDETNGSVQDESSDDDHRRKDKRRKSFSYLKPQSFASSLMTFTVVDTSIDWDEENPSKVIELKTLPPKTAKKSLGDYKTKPVALKSPPMSGTGNCNDARYQREQKSSRCLEPTKNLVEHLEDGQANATVKHEVTGGVKSGVGQLKTVDLIEVNRRKLSSCNSGCCNEGTSELVGAGSGHKEPGFALSSPVERGNNCISYNSRSADSQIERQEDSRPASYIVEKGETIKVEDDVNHACGRNLIDLNSIPRIQIETVEETWEQKNIVGERVDPFGKVPPLEISHSDTLEVGVSPQVQDRGNSEELTLPSEDARRRHSTRNRPLTTKALEALEIGFLNSKQNSLKRRNNQEQRSRPRRRQRSEQHAEDVQMRPNGILNEKKSSSSSNCLDQNETSAACPMNC